MVAVTERDRPPLIASLEERKGTLRDRLDRTKTIDQFTFAEFVGGIMDCSPSSDQSASFRTAALYDRSGNVSVHLVLNGQSSSVSAYRGEHEESIEFIQRTERQFGIDTTRTIPYFSMTDPKAEGHMCSILTAKEYERNPVNLQPLTQEELRRALATVIDMIGNPSPYTSSQDYSL